MSPHICFHPPAYAMQPRCDAQSPATNSAPETPRRPRGPTSPQTQVAVILMRHGQTDWNYAGRVQGGLDKSRLNAYGRRQARQAGLWLRKVGVDTVFCSPLTRARDTLRIATDASENRALQGKKPELLESLKEIQVPWQGLHKKEIFRSYLSKAYLAYSKNPPRFSYNGFSPLRDIVRRAGDVWETVRRTSGSCYLLVSHNQMNKALICTALGLPTVLSAWRQGNCCFNVIMLEDGKHPRLRLCNGSDQPADRNRGRKITMRQGCMRVFLHQHGGCQSLAREIGDNDISHFYLLGNTSTDNLEQLDIPELQDKCTRIPFPKAGDVCMYDSAVEVLDTLRSRHDQELVVVSVPDSLVLRAVFAASIGLGNTGVDRLLSDMGGVSIVDIRVSDPVGSVVTYVEGYNIGAWFTPDALVGYTRSSELYKSHES